MTDEIVVDAAMPEDAPALAELWLEAFPLKFAHAMGEAARPLVTEWLGRAPELYAHTSVARANGVPVGYIQFRMPRGRHAAWGRLRLAGVLFGAVARHLGVLGGLVCLARLAVAELESVASTELHIEMIGVDPAWRGHGVGSRLLACAEEEGRRLGRERLRLGVVSENTGAKRLYERFGFVAGPERHSRLARWACGSGSYFDMTKDLGPASD